MRMFRTAYGFLLATMVLAVSMLWAQTPGRRPRDGARRGARPAANQPPAKIDPRAKTMKPYFATCRQTFTIVFKNTTAARAAKVRPLPLYDGKEWAISCRWDDNSPSDVRMRNLMDKYGFKGTFYMNSGRQGYWGKSYGLVKNNKDVDRMLVAAGRHTIGGHGARHPSLGVLSRNRIFEEAMRVRADRESTSDTPICSYSFSNMNWSNAIEGMTIGLDIGEALFRAGYYHNANARYLAQTGLKFPACWLLPWDGAAMQRWVEAMERFQANESIRRDNPCLSFSMHAPAYGTEEKWKRLEEKFRNYGGRKEWWYCNQSEYAAYRLQFAHTKVETAVEGNRLVVTLDRPALRDLNDNVPLTFDIEGTDAVVEVQAEDAKVEKSADGWKRFHLHHDGTQKLPERIGWVHNRDNRSEPGASDVDEDFPKLTGLLWREGESLKLSLRNGGEAPLEDVRITYRLPPAFADGMTIRPVERIAPGAEHSDTLRLRQATDDYRFHSGVAFFAAQVDFVRGGKGGRLHLTAGVVNPKEDESYPVGRFLVLGQAPTETLTPEVVKRAAEGDFAPVTAGTKAFHWKPTGRAFVEFLHPEAIYGKPPAAERMLQGGYLLATIIRSPKAQTLEMALPARRSGFSGVYLNGRQVEDVSLALKEGANLLLLVYGRGRDRAILFRLVSSGTGQRAADIRYELPKVDG